MKSVETNSSADRDSPLSRETATTRELVQQRWYLLFIIGGLFVALNGALIWLIGYGLTADIELIATDAALADKRLITSGVLQTLVGATVVQTGLITRAMTRYLFPNHPS